MTIKDVSKLTGLTIKSIRYYEEKGLIHVLRNDENDYRKYTEEDVERLKLIKILRYIDFSIEEISIMFKENKIQDALKEKSKQLGERSNDYLEKQAICDSLHKEYKKKKSEEIISEYSETINFLESDDGKTTKNSIISLLCPNLSSIIVQSLVYIGPILWLFINIHNQKWDAMFLNSICSIICTVFLVLEWNYYFEYRKKFKTELKEKNIKNSLTIPVAILGIIITLVISILIGYGFNFFAPKDYLFYETSFLVTKLMICSITFIILLILVFLLKKLKVNRTEIYDDYLFLFKKLKYVFIICEFILIYCFITSVTFVTKDKIIYRDPLHPFGIIYNYNDVTKIETGFGNKNFAFIDYNRKGGFYYRIYFGNKKFTFSAPMPNPKIEKYEENSYLELEEFDLELRKYNIQKSTDKEYADMCDFDKEFRDRFSRIIDN